VIRGALVGTAKPAKGLNGDGTAPVEAQGGGTVDIEAATATKVIASPTTLTFGRALGAVKVSRVLTLTNTSGATVHVSLSLANDGEGADGASIKLAGAPRGWRSPRARACPCRSPCERTGCPRRRR
jgi:hypothetical protein